MQREPRAHGLVAGCVDHEIAPEQALVRPQLALPDAERWRESLQPLRGYRVEPVEGRWEPGFQGILTRCGRWRMTEIVIEFEPIGRASVQVKGGVRVKYRVGDSEGHVDLPSQLSVCAPSPCRPVRPEGF